MSAVTLTPARALREPRRVDWRAVFGILLMIVAAGGSIAFWTASSDTRSVLVATRDLPAGATLGPGDLAVARVRVDDAIYAAAVPADNLAGLVGRQLAEPVHAHQILVAGQVSTRPRLGPNQLALTIAISPDTAVGGILQPGDQVRVLLTTDKDKPDARTTVVLPSATVYDVGRAASAASIGSDTTSPTVDGVVRWVTLAVTPEQAIALAHARWTGSLDVALVPPGQGIDNGRSGGNPAGP